VPPASSRALEAATGSGDYTEVAFPVGHIGIYVSARVQQVLPRTIAEWLQARTGDTP
jgi:polyhydroxyalkanoate synthase